MGRTCTGGAEQRNRTWSDRPAPATQYAARPANGILWESIPTSAPLYTPAVAHSPRSPAYVCSGTSFVVSRLSASRLTPRTWSGWMGGDGVSEGEGGAYVYRGLHQLTHLYILPYTPRRPLCQRDRLHMFTWYTHRMDISNHTHTHVSWAALPHRV